ncbi:uncharacterized protein C7orf50 homolog [Phacochoerus africanus]|uniref:uncharacterized protein C7orf50 homolog n=1 Tax=Phacochoerus africanus TaxID=41426 RepID=UPI001FD94629|nr:uncharacterized protein C7orf50 homolog [Phacochoerus africanus]
MTPPARLVASRPWLLPLAIGQRGDGGGPQPMGRAAPEGGSPLPGRRVCRKPALEATRRMAKQKRKDTGVTEKKSKKLKTSAREMPPAPAAPAATDEVQGAVSPEEQRVLDRKLKKERKKEARRLLREAGIPAAQSPPARPSGAELALDYLCGWAQKREDWRFQKTRQTWLLVHMYDRDQVSEEHFPTLLAYLEGLQGRARELTVQKAEALMQELDQAGAGAEASLLGKTQRARQVLQLLS